MRLWLAQHPNVVIYFLVVAVAVVIWFVEIIPLALRGRRGE